MMFLGSDRTIRCKNSQQHPRDFWWCSAVEAAAAAAARKHFLEVRNALMVWLKVPAPSERQSVFQHRPIHRKSLPYMVVTGYCVCSYKLQLCYVSVATKTSLPPLSSSPSSGSCFFSHSYTHTLVYTFIPDSLQPATSDSVWLTLITFSPKFSSHQHPELSPLKPFLITLPCFVHQSATHIMLTNAGFHSATADTSPKIMCVCACPRAQTAGRTSGVSMCCITHRILTEPISLCTQTTK